MKLMTLEIEGMCELSGGSIQVEKSNKRIFSRNLCAMSFRTKYWCEGCTGTGWRVFSILENNIPQYLFAAKNNYHLLEE